MKNLNIIAKKELLIITILITFDRIFKLIIDTNLFENQSINLNKYIAIHKIYNTGISFSSLQDKIYLIIILNTLVLTLVLYLKNNYQIKQKHYQKYFNLIFLFLLSGGIGNLIDRIIYKHVIDYIQVNIFNFPIFNLADIYVSIGMMILIMLIIKGAEFETNSK